MKYMEDSHLEEISIYEALEYYASGCQVECHIEDQDGVVQSYEKYFIQDGLDKSVSFLELIAGKWFIDKHYLMHMEEVHIDEYDEGDM